MRFAALFMIALMLTLPVAFAQELSITKYSGTDNVDGYSKIQDTIAIQAYAKVPGEDVISKEQLRFYQGLGDPGANFIFFDTCVPTGDLGYYECTLIDENFTSYEPFDFTVELRDDDDAIRGSEYRTIIPDGLPPRINISVSPVVNQGPVTVTYQAEDFSFVYGDTLYCSGIKSVVISANTTAITQFFTPGTCVAANVTSMTLPAGTTQVCGYTRDHIGYESPPNCVSVTVDSGAPVIEQIAILSGGKALTHVHSGRQELATVQARITDVSGVETVTADLSQLSPGLSGQQLPTSRNGDIYIWNSIPISEVSPCTLSITARDTLGNQRTEQRTCDIRADDTAPTFKQLIPLATKEGKPLYGLGTNVIIQLEDKDNDGNPGSGFTQKKAYLDLTALQLGDFVQADSCVHRNASIWECSWLLAPPPTVGEGPVTISLSEGTSDDLDNVLGSRQNFEIIYDNAGPYPPTVIDFKIISGQNGTQYQGGAVRGNYVQYTVRSGQFLNATANFSAIGGPSRRTATSCTTGAAERDCVFESIVDLSGPYAANISFTFTDEAGNTAMTSAVLQVYGIDNELTAAYWNIAGIECTPSTVGGKIATVDRTLASAISPYVTCAIALDTPRTDISTLAVTGPSSPDSCGGDVTLNLQDVYLTNGYEGSTQPFLFYALEPQEFYVNELNFSCPINVYSKRNVSGAYYVSPNSQRLNINTTVQFYNNPLGDLHEQIDEKIENALDDDFANSDFIGTLRDILAVGEKICEWKTILTSVISSLNMIAIALGITSKALYTNPLTAPAGAATDTVYVTTCNIEQDSEELYKGWLGWADPICNIVGCSAAGGKQSDIEGVLGGALDVPWCTDSKKFLDDLSYEFAGGGLEEANVKLNVKESIVLSTACLCLPGIVYNLEKIRQISCYDAVCLYDQVREDGYPTSFCDEMQDYLTCKYVVGQVFALLPFTAFFDKMISIVVDLFANPVNVIPLGIGAFCRGNCWSAKTQSEAYTLCSVARVVAMVGEAWATIDKIASADDVFAPVGDQYCQRMEEIKEEREGDDA